MSRQKDFIEAGIQYRMKHGKPMAIGGDKFADVANEMNRCKDFEAGAEFGYQYAVDKACEWLYDWNKEQVEKHGSRAVLGIREFTIAVSGFRKAMEE